MKKEEENLPILDGEFTEIGEPVDQYADLRVAVPLIAQWIAWLFVFLIARRYGAPLW